jgi:hypothetical protein
MFLLIRGPHARAWRKVCGPPSMFDATYWAMRKTWNSITGPGVIRP